MSQNAVSFKMVVLKQGGRLFILICYCESFVRRAGLVGYEDRICFVRFYMSFLGKNHQQTSVINEMLELSSIWLDSMGKKPSPFQLNQQKPAIARQYISI